MQGAHNAKLFVSSFLEGDMPRRLSDYRYALREEGKWFIDDETLPNPKRYLAYEPLALDEWPTIITLAMSTNSIVRSDYVPGIMDPLYRVTYAMRTYVWVRAEGEEACTLMRDRLTTVVRSALLDHPCLRINDPENYLEVMIDEGTMREEFSDLTLLKGDRVLAGAFISYDMTLNERITRAPIGTVTQFGVETELNSYE
jgi:hypothetical protein